MANNTHLRIKIERIRNNKIIKISASLMTVGIMAPTILFTANEAKANEQSQEQIQQQSDLKKKLGQGIA